MTATTVIELLRSKRPPAGVSLDETRSVRSSAMAPASCIKIRCDYAEICLPMVLLEDLGGLRLEKWQTEEERLSLIAAGRARKLMAAAARQQPLIAPLPTEITQLVVLLLESGAAHVRHAIDGTAMTDLEIRYIGQRFGPTAGFGRIVVSESHVGLPLLTCDWWSA